MKKKKKNYYALYYVVGITIILLCFSYIGINISNLFYEDDYSYVSDIIVDTAIPVLNETPEQPSRIVISPYNNEEVSISTNYYEHNDEEESQQKSLIYYENTYMQNSGILYQHTEVFDVLSVMDGVVTSVKEEELLGFVIEINHDTNFTTSYQCLKEVYVKEGDNVVTGAKIATSGIPKLIDNNKYSLLFETYLNGDLINPNNVIGKDISTLN